MEVFREMYIRGDSERVAELMNEMKESLPAGWHRDRGSETLTQAFMIGARSVYCFVHSQDDVLPSSTIYLAESSPGVLAVSNIHPHKKRQLTSEEYNSVLTTFYEQIVQPCGEKLGFEVTLTASRADLSDWLSDKAAEKFRAFSSSVNKCAGFLLTDDHERWIDFIVTAHGDNVKLDAPTLRRWLIEVEGWGPEMADQLAGEYAFGAELLAFTDSRRGEN